MPKVNKLLFLIVCGWIFVSCTWTQNPTFQKGPYLICPNTNTQMTVLWQTDATPSHSKIEWGKTTAAEISSDWLTESGRGSNEHQFSHTLTGLDPATRYFYRVTVDEHQISGSFLTAPSDTANAVIFYGYGDTRSNPADHDRVVERIMMDVDATNASHRQTFVLNSADWVADGDRESAWSDQYFARTYPNALEFMSHMPVMGSRGNHEGSAVLLRKYWPYDYRDGSGCYYSFDYGPVHVTVVDQYVDFTPGSAQHSWLQNDLGTTDKFWKFVLLHEPAWTAGGRHGNDVRTQQYLCPLFEQYGVAVVQAGHNHYYARCVVNGVAHITAGGGGAPLYDPDPGSENAVMTDRSLHFVKYEISAGRMTVTAIRSDGSVIERFEVIK